MKKINIRQSVQRKKSKFAKMVAKAACPILLAAVASLFPCSTNPVFADHLEQNGNNWTVVYDGDNVPLSQRLGVGSGENSYNVPDNDNIVLTVQANAKMKGPWDTVHETEWACISLRDDNTIDISGTLVTKAENDYGQRYPGGANNTIEFRSGNTLHIRSGAQVLATGTNLSGLHNSKNSEAINIFGGNNKVYIEKGALVQAEEACAVYMDYLDVNKQKNLFDNAGSIITNRTTNLGPNGLGNVIGTASSNAPVEFINRSTGYVHGNLTFADGDDIVRLETRATDGTYGIEGNINVGAGNDTLILFGEQNTSDVLGDLFILPGSTLTGFESLVKEGGSKWTLDKSIVNYFGSTLTSVAVDAGTLELQGDNSGYAGTMVVNSKGTDSGATLEAKSGSLTSGIDIVNSGIVRFLDEAADSEKTYAGKIIDGLHGAGNVEITKGGTIKLSNTGNSYTGETRVKNGTLVIDDMTPIGTGEIQLGDMLNDPDTKGTLRFDADNIVVANDILANASGGSGNAVIDTNGQASIEVIGAVTGGELTKTGDGTLYLNNLTNTQEETVIKQGTVSVGNVNDIGSMTSKVIFDNNGLGESSVLEVTGSTATNPDKPFTQRVELQSDGVVRVTDLNDPTNKIKVEWEGVMSGDGGLTKEGNGTLTLTGQNVYEGGTVIAQGELELGNGSKKGTIQGDVEIKDGASLAFNHDNVGEDKYVFEGDIVAEDNTKVIQRGGGHTVLTGDNDIRNADVVIEYGTIDVVGNGSNLIAKNIQIGNGSTGRLIANDEGDVEFVNSLIIGANGTLQVGADSGEAAVAPGQVKAQNPTGHIQNNGKIILNHNNHDGYVFDADLGGGIQGTVNSTIEMLAGRTVLVQDSSANLGTTNLRGGTLVMQGPNGNLGGTLNVSVGAVLEGNGTVGDLNNKGVVYVGFAKDHTNFYNLTASGNYEGQNGILALNTVLGDDNSSTDKLIVQGNTSGKTGVLVTNRGGLGAATNTGIKVIEVGGTSHDGDFELASNFVDPLGRKAIVAGAFGYHLDRNNVNQDWYLKSLHLDNEPPKPHDYQPAVAIYEAFPQILMQLNSMSSMSQRTGNRFWTSGPGSDCNAGCGETVAPCSPVSKMGNKTVEGAGLWVRTEGSFGKYDPSRSSSGGSYDIDMVRVQLGKDFLVGRGSDSVWVAGLNYMYGNASTDTRSVAGYRGHVKAEGHGVGATLTNYRRNGLYFDLQSQFNWYDSDMKSYDLRDSSTGLAYDYLAKGQDGFGYAVGFEIGQKIKLRNGWLATPQFQLVYSGVSFSSFNDVLDSRVALTDGQGLIGRWGWGMHREKSWMSNRGDCRRFDFFGIANLYYDFLDGTEVDINGHRVQNMNEQLWGGLGFGGTYNWRNDTRSLFAESEYRSSFSNASGNHLVNVAVGFRARF